MVQTKGGPPAIVVQRLGLNIGPRPILRDLDLHVNEGECLAIVGPNGAGKSTLLRILAGLLRPSTGTATVLGQDPARSSDARKATGLICHAPLLYPTLTAAENLNLFGTLYGMTGPAEQVMAALNAFGIGRAFGTPVRTLSRGMTQRVVLARAALHQPRVLLLDEPDTGLDIETADLLDKLINPSDRNRPTTILFTHHLGRAASFADRVAVLVDGRLSAVSRESLAAAHENPAWYREMAQQATTGTKPPDEASSVPPDATGTAREGNRGQPVIAAGLRSFRWLVKKDLTIEWRSREVALSSAVFAILVLVVFNFAFDLTTDNAAAIAPGVLWTALMFAGVLSISRSFDQERESGTLDGLLASPIDRTLIYAARTVSNAVLMLGVAAVALPAFVLFFNLDLHVGTAAAFVALGTLGFVAVGTLVAALTAGARGGVALYPLLLLPLEIPVALSVIRGLQSAIVGSTLGTDGFPWLGLLTAFNVIFIALSVIIFESIISD
ncbi:MAG: heme exporter protein CcmB [Chloroflexota bacterium]